MVKTEAFDDSHFMHQAVRVGNTDNTGSIVSPMVCIFDLKKKFLEIHHCYSLGMVKTEAFDDSHFMLLELVILITLVASFLPWYASLILKRNF